MSDRVVFEFPAHGGRQLRLVFVDPAPKGEARRTTYKVVMQPALGAAITVSTLDALQALELHGALTAQLPSLAEIMAARARQARL